MLAAALSVSIPAAVVVQQQGIVTVQVREKSPDGVDLYIPVPMAALNLALSLAPREELREAGREVAQYRDLVAAFTQVLEECPDGTFVDVVDHGESVQVVKAGGNLEVHVDGPHETVHVSFPLHAVNGVVQRLADAAE